MITIKGNILAVKQGFICHQTNCQGKLTSKLSNSLVMLWPRLSIDYVSAYRLGALELGEVVFTNINNRLYIATMCTQEDSNRMPGPKLNYPALGSCLRRVKDWYSFVGFKKLPIYLPWKIGCGRTGGNWETVNTIIKREVPNAIIVKL